MKTHPILTFTVTAVLAMLWVSFGREIDSRRLFAQASPDAAKSAPDSKAEPSGEDIEAAKAKAEAKAKVDKQAKQTLKKSREALVSFQSFKADIRQLIAIGGRRITARGRYVQGSRLKLRLELTLKLGSESDALSGHLLQVCNGQTLWTEQKIGSDPDELPRVTRQNVRQILDAVKASETNEELVPEKVMIAELGLGGLPALLASLEQSMTYSSLEQKTIKGKTFTVLKGTWNDALMRRFRKIGGPTAISLPTHIPDSVQIYLDPDHDLIPRRILYWKQDLFSGVMQPMVTLDFADIKLNGAVDEKEFQYSRPEGLIPIDVTNSLIERLKAGKPVAADAQSGQPPTAENQPTE